MVNWLKKLMIFVLVVTTSYVISLALTSKEEKKMLHPPENKNETILSNIIMIKLLHQELNQVEELPLEEYLKGVVLAEMPIYFEEEALKAQAIVARTFTLYQMKNPSMLHENADVCDDINCCQAYQTKEYVMMAWDDAVENEKWNKINRAVEDTKGRVILYQGEPIEAFFHSHSAGKTEDVRYLWNEEEIPYLKSVDGMEQDLFSEDKTFLKKEFQELIKVLAPNYQENDVVQIVDYTPSGRVFHVKLGSKIIKATDLRTLLKLRSTYFCVEENENEIIFHTEGYGHGVGMSQYGANQMALEGKKCEEIIQHYYTGVEIDNLDDFYK